MVQMHLQCVSSDGISENTGCRSGPGCLRDRVQPLVCGSCHSASPENRGMKSNGVCDNKRTSQFSACVKECQLFVGKYKQLIKKDTLMTVSCIYNSQNTLWLIVHVAACLSPPLLSPEVPSLLFLFKPHPFAEAHRSPNLLNQLSTLEKRGFPRVLELLKGPEII